jgi:hypothetical protein
MPYSGQRIARRPPCATVARVGIYNKEHVWVFGKKVKARRSDGAFEFRDGTIAYTIQGGWHLKDQDVWVKSDAGTKGLFVVV